MSVITLPKKHVHAIRVLKPPGWVRVHGQSLLIVAGLLAVVGIAHAWNMYEWPGHVNEDEGTYVAQAWAIIYRGSLTHYTYTYDHPPLGWMIIAAYAWVTDGFERTATALMVGREVMLLTNLVSCGLFYMLARRVGMHRAFAAAAVLVFAFSPLAMQYQRMVFLDNMAIAWVLAALVFAASPRRSLAAAIGSGLCFTGAVLTKETTALLLPAVIWLLLQHSDKRMRQWSLTTWSATVVTVTFFAYPLYAWLKNELVPGPGHVSLIGSLYWQVIGRQGTGSLLDPSSGTFGLAKSWFEADPVLLSVGIALIPAGFCFRQLRPFALGLFLLVASMFRSGYTPYPYIIALLPFVALLIGGVADSTWRLWRTNPALHHKVANAARYAVRPVVIVCALLFIATATPGWGSTLNRSATANLGGPYRDTTAWIEENIGPQQVIIVDDYLWTDLAQHGYTRQIWLYKVDLDPKVMAELLPNGYADADYVILGNLPNDALTQLPTVAQAIEHSEVVASFGNGEITVRKITKPHQG
jgi:4-amino-4-deoxy-L-arabinose transferase-like glycosyltransferase